MAATGVPASPSAAMEIVALLRKSRRGIMGFMALANHALWPEETKISCWRGALRRSARQGGITKGARTALSACFLAISQIRADKAVRALAGAVRGSVLAGSGAG